MEPDVIDDLDRRLRAARPLLARVDEHAFDAELLAGVRAQPIAARRAVPRAVAVPVAAGVTLTVIAVVMLGGPGDVGGPSSASAISQTLRWLDPGPGTVLHVRSVEAQDGRTTTRELWRSADSGSERVITTQGDHSFETSGDALYDAATDTIYDPPAAPPGGRSDKGGEPELPAGDPIVAKVRFLLKEGSMVVTGRENHNGTEAWAISLKPDAGRPVWKLWVSTDDGKPLELRDPGRDASEQPQVISWPTYEVLPASDVDIPTLTEAHPSARVVHESSQAAAVKERLLQER